MEWNEWYLGLTDQAVLEMFNSFKEFVEKQKVEQRPEPEKKKGRWEECQVELSPITDFVWPTYRFNFRGDYKLLHEAFSMIGFGGFLFEEIPNRWFSDLVMTDTDGGDYCDCDNGDLETRPATPQKVRFWIGN